ASLLYNLRILQPTIAQTKQHICYSIKTNANLAICRLMQEHGAGFDVTSGGELYRALKAGGTGPQIVFAGVGKTDTEIRQGIDAGVLMFNVESDAELAAVARVAEQAGKPVDIALRVNPDVDPKTHEKTTTGKRGTKFGMDWHR